MGTPDASDVARAIGELRLATEELRQSVERVEQRVVADSDTNARHSDDTRHQLDQLRAAVLEQAETLDRIAGQTLGRPPT